LVPDAKLTAVSIGIAHNVLLAKLATRRAKPAGVFHLLPLAIPAFLAPLDVEDLPSIGWSIKSRIKEHLSTTTCGDLLEHSKRVFQAVLGPKTGEMVYGYLRGDDDRKLEPHKERKSISAEMNVSLSTYPYNQADQYKYGIRFQHQEQAEICVTDLAAEVSKRMKQVNARGKLLTLKLLKRHPDAPIEPPKVSLAPIKANSSSSVMGGARLSINPHQSAIKADRIRMTQPYWVLRLLSCFER